MTDATNVMVLKYDPGNETRKRWLKERREEIQRERELRRRIYAIVAKKIKNGEEVNRMKIWHTVMDEVSYGDFCSITPELGEIAVGGQKVLDMYAGV